MAAKSGGCVDWLSVVKPIFSSSHESFYKNEVSELVQAIIDSEAEFTSHEEQYEAFYTSFAALVADYISGNVDNIPKNQIATVWQACRILLKYLVGKQPGDGSSTILTMKQLLLPIKALCTGQSLLTKTEEIALIAIMKNSNIPLYLATSSSAGEKDYSYQLNKDSKKTRNDLSTSILEQLVTPLQDYIPIVTFLNEAAPEVNKNHTESSGNNVNNEIKIMFIANNIGTLQNIGAGDTLLDMCCNLPHLSRYMRKYQAYMSKKGFSLPANHAEAHIIRHSLHSVVNDINIVHTVLSLPVLEPLTSAKLEKLSLLTMSCLYCSIANATASSIVGVSNAVSPKCNTNSTGIQGNQGGRNTEEDYDSLAITVVEKTLEIFGLASNIIKCSTRAGGHILQNHLLIGVWLLVAGLQAQLTVSSFSSVTDKNKEEKGKSPSKVRDGTSRINLMKV